MMSRSSMRTPVFAVWLLVVAMLCTAVFPSLAVAKYNREIDTEGDPGDGMDSAGGGAGGQDYLDGENSSVVTLYDFRFHMKPIVLIPFWTNGTLYFELVFFVQDDRAVSGGDR